jgi:hypothetical protein
MPDIKSELAKIAPALTNINFDDDPQPVLPTVVSTANKTVPRRVLDFLQANPNSTTDQVARGLNIPVGGFGTLMKRLTDDGRLTRSLNPGSRQYLYMVVPDADSDAWPKIGRPKKGDTRRKAKHTPTASAQSPSSTGADAIQIDGSHYKDMAVQPWAVMEMVLSHEEFVGFLKGNVIKYSMRQGRKEGANHDGKKALHYKQKLDEVLKGKA